MSDLEKQVISKLGGKEAYTNILSLLVNQLDDDKLIDIAGQVSSKLQSKVKTYISDKKISNTYDRRSILRHFFREWESMFASTEDEADKLSTRRLVNILQNPDLGLISLAQEIDEAVTVEENHLQTIKVLLSELEALCTENAHTDYVPSPQKLLEYLKQKNVDAIASLNDLTVKQTGLLSPRLSRIICESSFLMEAPIKGKLKNFLNIPLAVLGKQGEELDLNTFGGYLEDVLGSEPTTKLEAKLYTSGLQGCGKTSVVQSFYKPQLSETTGKECTQLMEAHEIDLKRKNGLKIELQENGKLNMLSVLHKQGNAKIDPSKKDNTKVNFSARDEDKEERPVQMNMLDGVASNQNDDESEEEKIIQMNVLDTGGHDEYTMVTKALFSGKAPFLIMFDGTKYTRKTYYRHIGIFLETILEQAPSAVIVLVATKCDKGKKYITKSQKKNLIEIAKKHIFMRRKKEDEIPYLFDEVFELTCFERKLLPIFKDASLCGNIYERCKNICNGMCTCFDKKQLPSDTCKYGPAKNNGMEDLIGCIAELYLDTTLKEGQSIIPVEREDPSKWNKFHDKLKKLETQPLTYSMAEEVYMTCPDESTHKDENEEIKWFLDRMKHKNMTQESVVDEIENSSAVENKAGADKVASVTDINKQTKHASLVEDKRQNQVPKGIKVRCKTAIINLMHSGKVVILNSVPELMSKDEFPDPELSIFPDARLLTDSLRIVLNHNFESILDENGEIWCKPNWDNRIIGEDERKNISQMLQTKGFMSRSLMKALFKKAQMDNKKCFLNQETIEKILTQDNFACEWKYEGEADKGWLIPSLIRRSVTDLRKDNLSELKKSSAKKYWKCWECPIEAPLIGVGVAHRMMLNLLQNIKDENNDRSIRCEHIANQPLEERDGDVSFIFIGQEKKLGEIILIEEERYLGDKCDPFPTIKYLKLLIQNSPGLRKEKELEKRINESFSQELPIEIKEITPIDIQSEVTPLTYPKSYKTGGGKDENYNCFPQESNRNDVDPQPPNKEAKGCKRDWNFIKSLFTLGGVFASFWTVLDLATHSKTQSGNYKYCWIIYLAILYYPVVFNWLGSITLNFKNSFKIAFSLLQIILGPAMSAVATWLWLWNTSSNEFWHFWIKTNINFGILPKSLKLIYTSFLNAYGIVPLPWNKTQTVLEDSEGNTISMPAPTIMFILDLVSLIYAVYDNWTKFPPQDRQEDKDIEYNIPFLNPIEEGKISEMNQLEWKRKLYISLIFSVLITAFRLISISLVTIYLSYWVFIIGFVISLIVFIGLYLCTHVSKKKVNRKIQKHPNYDKIGIIWIFILLLPIPTPSYSKRATHTLLLHFSFIINIILLLLLYVVLLLVFFNYDDYPFLVFFYHDYKVSCQLLISNNVLVILTITSAALMPLATFWHYWLTWAHTHRRILPKFKDEDTQCCSLPLKRCYCARKTLIYLCTLFTLGLSIGLIIISSNVDTTPGMQSTARNCSEISKNSTITVSGCLDSTTPL